MPDQELGYVRYLAELPDPRSNRSKHMLHDILGLTLCAVIYGCRYLQGDRAVRRDAARRPPPVPLPAEGHPQPRDFQPGAAPSRTPGPPPSTAARAGPRSRRFKVRQVSTETNPQFDAIVRRGGHPTPAGIPRRG